MPILITGAAGFIGHGISSALLARGEEIIGIDNLSDYYSVSLKQDRLADLTSRFKEKFTFLEVDFSNFDALTAALRPHRISSVVHMGAQPGVRYSLENPHAYVRSNLVGHLNLLEFGRQADACDHFVYASSSSVYGGNDKLPFSVRDRTDLPVSLYAATKRADELMSESYAHLYRLPQTGLRFFTVYGPWGRPDMTPWIFTESILTGKPISLFNKGEISRDFTYIDDIVDGVVRCFDHPPADDNKVKAGGSFGPHRIYNIGNSRSEKLTRLVEIIERETGRKAIAQLMPMQPGDVKETFADISEIQNELGYRPVIPLDVGIQRFVEWYRGYRNIGA
jgi:UDP-glucuronate 4-epimerase